MTLEVRLRPEAELDLADAATWHEEQREGLGHEFPDEVLATLSSLSNAPQMFPVVHRETRRALIRRFPFAVYFRVEAAAIVVLAVMHGGRDPRNWKKRT